MNFIHSCTNTPRSQLTIAFPLKEIEAILFSVFILFKILMYRVFKNNCVVLTRQLYSRLLLASSYLFAMNSRPFLLYFSLNLYFLKLRNIFSISVTLFITMCKCSLQCKTTLGCRVELEYDISPHAFVRSKI